MFDEEARGEKITSLKATAIQIIHIWMIRGRVSKTSLAVVARSTSLRHQACGYREKKYEQLSRKWKKSFIKLALRTLDSGNF